MYKITAINATIQTYDFSDLDLNSTVLTIDEDYCHLYFDNLRIETIQKIDSVSIKTQFDHLLVDSNNNHHV
jgi:hypothetical protein